MADWFIVADDLAFLTDNVVAWFAYGIGLGAILWIIGSMVHWISLFLRY